MKTNTRMLVIVGALGLILLGGCTEPKFRDLAGTDSYYSILARDQLYHADSVSIQGSWVVAEAWTKNLSKRPVSPPQTKTVWIPRDAITRIEIHKGSN